MTQKTRVYKVYSPGEFSNEAHKQKAIDDFAGCNRCDCAANWGELLGAENFRIGDRVCVKGKLHHGRVKASDIDMD